MIFRLLNNESKTIVGAAAIVGVLSFVSRLFGLLRDRILSGTFGAGDVLDAYYVAFKLPDLVFSLVVVGSLSACFIPTFGKHWHALCGKDRAWVFVNNTLHLLLAAMGTACLVAACFSGPIASLLAPGFPPEKQAMVAGFMRIMLLAQFLLSASAVFGSALQGMKRFFAASFAPILYNFGIIAGALFLVPAIGVAGLAWGVVLGAFLHLFLQMIALFATGYRYSFRFDPKDKDARLVAKLAGPRMLAVSFSYVSAIVFTAVASTLSSGSVTIFQFAYNIEYLPIGIIGVPFAVAAFPSFVERLSHNDREGFVRLFSNSVRQVLFLIVPLALVFLLLRAQIVRTVVGTGAFDWASTIATADTLAFFAIGFVPQCLVLLLARAFFALEDTATPLTTGAAAAVLGIFSAMHFTDVFGVAGLGMAFVVASFTECILLWVALRQRLGTLGEADILSSFLKIGGAAVVAGTVIQLLKPPLAEVLETRTLLGIFLQGLCAGGAGLIVYTGIAYFVRSRELAEFLAGLRRTVLRASIPSEPVGANPTPGTPE